MSNKIEDLQPELQEKCLALLQKCAQQGILLRVTHTLRTWDEQQALYDQGRTKPGPRVTNARPGYSYHNYGLAFDVCQVGSDPYPTSDGWWEYIGRIGEGLGLEWGGDWKFPDRPHFQLTGQKTLAQLREEHQQEEGMA